MFKSRAKFDLVIFVFARLEQSGKELTSRSVQQVEFVSLAVFTQTFFCH